MKPVIIVGGGGHATALICGFTRICIVGIVDKHLDKHHALYGIGVLGDDDALSSREDSHDLINAIGSVGDMAIRKKVYDKLSKRFKFVGAVHPDSSISKYTTLEDDIQVLAGAVIQAGVRVGKNSIINANATICHDCTIGDHVHVAPGTILSGGVTVGNETHIGCGSTIIQDINIGSGCTIGAGSLIIRDVPDGATVFGRPAKIVEK